MESSYDASENVKYSQHFVKQSGLVVPGNVIHLNYMILQFHSQVHIYLREIKTYVKHAKQPKCPLTDNG